MVAEYVDMALKRILRKWDPSCTLCSARSYYFYNGLSNKHTICNTGRVLPIRFGKARFHKCFANKGKEVTLALKNSVRSVVDIVENVYLFYRNKSLIVHLKKDSSSVRSGNSISIEGNNFDMVNEIYSRTETVFNIFRSAASNALHFCGCCWDQKHD